MRKRIAIGVGIALSAFIGVLLIIIGRHLYDRGSILPEETNAGQATTIELIKLDVPATEARAQATAVTKNALSTMTVAELIDRLAEIANEGPGSHSTAWMHGFIAVDEEMQFAGGVLGSKPPSVSPVMRELVVRGVDALPELIDHLSDSRETKLNAGSGGFIMAKWHSDEYSPRYGDPKQQPPRVNTNREKDCSAYTLAIGDLCFVTIGQIVNRGLNVVRYQPTACLVINSPVEWPALAAAVKQDWSGLTAEALRQSLLTDVQEHYPTGALKRLCFYYPKTGEEVAVKLLRRPIYDDEAVFDFVSQRLLLIDDPTQWSRRIKEFGEQAGSVNGRAVVLNLLWYYSFPRSQSDAEREIGREKATRILKKVYPEIDPDNPPLVNAVQAHEQTEVILALSGVRSKNIDQAVKRCFRSIDLEQYRGSHRVHADDLALSCMDRLNGQGLDDEFAGYCEKRIQELKAKKREIAEDQRLEFLTARLARLQPEK